MSGLTTTQKHEILKLHRKSGFVGVIREVTARALVRRTYAVWHDERLSMVRLTPAGVKFAKTGQQL